ncbi:MAG: outer membrane protein assembly factor BamD [Chitinophagales bacterium]|nr:outer membrane protein assembly factor BamD [Bacteroidota bacterium]MCB9043657.1 outer membrane protein assembly factor BamD [Chitinophagales bacterium]
MQAFFSPMLKHILFCLCLLWGFSACNTYQKVLKSSDYDYKLEKAKEYYNAGAYEKAIPLFEELIGVYKGTRSVEDLYYYYPYCYYGKGDYILASFYFKNFLEYYPRSDKAEDARYMVAYCYYKMSPSIDLEQTNTQKAMEAFQLFVNTYPQSDRVEKCNALMDELRRKLEEKAFVGAQLYYDLKDYRAAVTAYNNLLLDFPETPEREKVHFLIVKSYYLLASNSIYSKQLERFELAESAYLDFLNKFPDSKYLREAEKMYTTSLNKIDELKSNN